MTRLLPSALALALLLPASADAKIKVKIPGWTTEPIATTPQAKNGGTIAECRDTGNGQRSLRVIVRGKGIAKNTRVGIGVWGGNPQTGFGTEPTDEQVMKTAFKWPVGKKKTYTTPYGFSFAAGPFGPQDINGVWNAKVIVKKKVVKRGSVTVAC